MHQQLGRTRCYMWPFRKIKLTYPQVIDGLMSRLAVLGITPSERFSDSRILDYLQSSMVARSRSPLYEWERDFARFIQEFSYDPSIRARLCFGHEHPADTMYIVT